MSNKISVDPDITRAKTLPASFYRDSEVFERIKDQVFYRSWQWIGDRRNLNASKTTIPFILLEGFLNEPMVLTRDNTDKVHCLSNVCTHRGNLVVASEGKAKKLICGYHGRRFKLSGQFEHMPEFGETKDFPGECDDLYSFPIREWGPFLFAGLNPDFDFQSVIDAMNERVGFLPLDEFFPDESRNKDYHIHAHWALYCDNYLEGFHIPFVHEDLNAVLDYGDYETVLHDYMNLQIGYAKGSEDTFDLPPGHIDYGKKIAAYYYWVFPNMMFNFYPWGLSVNLVQPMDKNKTKVSFLTYVYDADKLGKGAGTGLDKVEMEDEEVVEGVYKGIQSRFYQTGRFSPSREQGVHHFHLLLSKFLNN